jgi:hypothetical protein
MGYLRLSGPPAMGIGQQNVQLDTADVLNLADDLRAQQARLTNLFQQMQGDPALAAAIGRDVTSQQQSLGDLISKYVGVYTAIFGQAPAGLTGLGRLGNPVLIAGAVAIVIGAVAAGLYAWKLRQNVLEQQAQAAILAEQNRGSIISMAQQKQTQADQLAAAGNTQGAADVQNEVNLMLQQAGVPGAPPPPQNFGDWVKANAVTIGLIGAAVFLVPKFLER